MSHFSYTDASSYSSASSHMSDSSSDYGSTHFSDSRVPPTLSASIENLLYSVYGEFALSYFENGTLVQCGSLRSVEHTDDISILSSPWDEPSQATDISPYAGSDSSRPSSQWVVPSMPAESIPKTQLSSTCSPVLISPQVTLLSPSTEHLKGTDFSQDGVYDPATPGSSSCSPSENANAGSDVGPMNPIEQRSIISGQVSGSDATAMVPAGTKNNARGTMSLKWSTNSMRKRTVLRVVPAVSRKLADKQLNELWTLVSGFKQLECKALCIASLATLRPTRRLTHPFGSEAPEWWPQGVRYIDSSHLLMLERMALLFHLWVDIRYADDDLRSISEHPLVQRHFPPQDITRLFRLVLRIRTIVARHTKQP